MDAIARGTWGMTLLASGVLAWAIARPMSAVALDLPLVGCHEEIDPHGVMIAVAGGVIRCDGKLVATVDQVLWNHTADDPLDRIDALYECMAARRIRQVNWWLPYLAIIKAPGETDARLIDKLGHSARAAGYVELYVNQKL